jgi:hypothetical protein
MASLTQDVLKYFKGSFIVAFLVFFTLFLYTQSILDLYSALTLTIIEISLSFDNAIVNASILKDMNSLWKKLFLTVGIFIAVGVMRAYLPIQIVSSINGIPLLDAASLAFDDRTKFAEILTSSSYLIDGFGGAFLLMLGLEYFINAEKETHWFNWLEEKLSELDGLISYVQILVTGVLSYIISTHIEGDGTGFFYASLAGIVTFILVDALKAILNSFNDDDAKKSNGLALFLAGGFGQFVYLEVLDASFSFDGVIAAFAISNDILVIAAGLGVGAYFVRSLTLMLDDKGTLAEFRFLENGAFWAITLLSLFMLFGPVIHFPEWIIAGSSVLLIGLSLYHSILEKRKDADC